ncbi:MAG: TolC family protein [Lysobacterales bacterium]
MACRFSRPALGGFAVLLLSGLAIDGANAAAISPDGSSAGLSFEQALALASEQSPAVQAVELERSGAEQDRERAAQLPDPKLLLGLDNFPVGGGNAYSLDQDFMTMRAVGLMQEMPNRAKRRARAERATARVSELDASREAVLLATLRDTAVAWVERHSIEQQLGHLDELDRENQLFDAAVRAAFAGGKGSATDLVLPREEAARIADRRDRLQAERAAAIAALRRRIGAAAERDLVGASPAYAVDAGQLHAELHEHPNLKRFDARGAELDAEVREALAGKRPDWSLAFKYQDRAERFGDMVSLELSIDLPLFGRHRQDPAIAAKRAERAAVDAEREALWREHLQALETELAEYRRLDQAWQRNREQWLPLAREKAALALAAYQGGSGTLADLIAARRARIETELEGIALAGQRAAAAAALHYISAAVPHPEYR